MTDVRSSEGSGVLGFSVPRAEWLIAAALFLAALAYFSGTLHRTIDLRDEGYLLYDIRQTAEGRIAHRDFVALYVDQQPGLAAAGAQAEDLDRFVSEYETGEVKVKADDDVRFLGGPLGLQIGPS